MFFHVIHPGAEVVDTFLVGYVVDQEDSMGISEVTRDQAFESLLASGIPELQSDVSFVDLHIF